MAGFVGKWEPSNPDSTATGHQRAFRGGTMLQAHPLPLDAVKENTGPHPCSRFGPHEAAVSSRLIVRYLLDKRALHVAFMWQLELLSWVIPAFGSLAQKECDNPDANLSEDAKDCYSDIVNIGLALSVSHGEWALGLRDEEVTRLLVALESRLPTRWTPFIFTTPYLVRPFIPPTVHHYSEAHCSSRRLLWDKVNKSNFQC